MRLTGTCWSCAIALAAVFVQGTWAAQVGKRGERRKKHNNSSKDRSNSWSKQAQKVVEAQDSDDDFPDSKAGQPVSGLAPTPRPTNTRLASADVSPPRVTDGPALFRRKTGSMRWDALQDGFLGQKRDGGACPTNYQLCASSLGGGCCPQDGYSCGTSSCLPTSAGPATACGYSGYVACNIADGGGCCPGGYICAAESCSPSPGVTSTLGCGANSFKCPASLGGGCCLNGMGCNLHGCYNTTPITFTLVETLTTTGATLTSTITSTTVSGAPDPTQTVDVLVPKVSPSATALAKVQATSTSNGGGGLSTAALGGIIGGAIFFLTAILIAAIFIIRGLNRVSKAQEMTNSRSGSSQQRSRRSGQRRGTVTQEADTISIDPLMMTGSTVSGSIRYQSGISSPQNTIPEMEGSGSPPVFHSPFSPRSPPHTHYPRGYNPVPGSDSQYSQSSGGGHYRSGSLESSPPIQQSPNSYFDIPIQQRNNNNRASFISSQTRRPSQHGRNYSNSSDVSQTSSQAAELDAGKDGSRKNSVEVGSEEGKKSGLQRFMTRLVRRRQSDPPVLTGGPVRTMDSGPTSNPREGGALGGGLGLIDEAGESKINVNRHMQQGPIVPSQESRIAVDRHMQQEPMTPFQDISLMDQPAGFRSS